MEVKIEKIIRSKRKTIALQLTDNATLIVKAPFEVSEDTIMRVVSKHKKWISQKKKDIEKREQKLAKKEFVSGEGFLFLGQYYKLEVVNNQEEPLKFDNKFYLSSAVLPNAREVFINWYKKVAYEKISERVSWHANRSGLKYTTVKITDAKTRWGSCGHKGGLNFSWRLIMAPLSVIDYVIIHELAHLKEKNHSKTFWNKVRILMPDYEKYKNWLKNNSYLLNF